MSFTDIHEDITFILYGTFQKIRKYPPSLFYGAGITLIQKPKEITNKGITDHLSLMNMDTKCFTKYQQVEPSDI